MDTHLRAVRRTLAVLLALTSVAAVACSSSQTAGSKVQQPVAYSADDGRFKAEFPSAPTREENPVSVAGLDLVIVTYSTQTKKDALTVGYTDYPEVADPAQVLDGAADGSASNVGGTIESKTDTTFLGHPAKDVVISTSDAGVYERIFLVDNRLYMLIGVAQAGRPAAYDRLLETFALM